MLTLSDITFDILAAYMRFGVCSHGVLVPMPNKEQFGFCVVMPPAGGVVNSNLQSIFSFPKYFI